MCAIAFPLAPLLASLQAKKPYYHWPAFMYTIRIAAPIDHQMKNSDIGGSYERLLRLEA